MSRIPCPPVVLAILLGLITGCDERSEPPHASESWLRIDTSGDILSREDRGPHRCVLDPTHGLLWQVHDKAGDLHDRDNRYTWYSNDRHRHMSEPGLADGGDCRGSGCDTESLVAAINERGLCGFTDWRLPSREELMSLGEAGRRDIGLIVDPAYFPEAVAGEYWTGETFRLYPQSAWAVHFGNGLDRADLKSEAKAVRLVRRHARETPTN